MENLSTNTVFITGVSGYTGRAVAVAFRRQGYKVFGLLRNKSKVSSSLLLEEEIIPIIGDVTQPETYKEALASSGIVIDCASVSSTTDQIQTLLNATKESSKESNNPRKLFIWTTGFLQYKHEDLVLKNKDFDGCVVRPGFIYGGIGGVVFENLLFKQFEGKLKIGGNPKKIWPWVHINDLANGFLAIVNASQQRELVQGKIFRFGTLDASLTYERVRLECAKAWGYQGNEFECVEAEGMEKFIDNDVKEFDTKDSVAIGWKSRFGATGFLKEMDLHYNAFLAWRKNN